MKDIVVCAIQQACNLDKQANLDYSISQIQQAASHRADIVVLPELHSGPYFCQTEDPEVFQQAEPIPGPTTELLCKTARQNQIIIIATLFEKRAPGLYHNTAVIIDKNGSIAGRYRKMHIPDDPGYYEKFYFTPGDLGFTPVETSVGKLGVLICWDQWYPEAARLMSLAGAEILIYPTAIGWDPKDSPEEKQRQTDAWITIQRSHAIANGIPVISCNRIGYEASPDNQSGIEFWGNSFIAGPQGEILCQANNKENKLLIQTISQKRVTQVRNIWPFFRDRRIDAFDNLNKRFID